METNWRERERENDFLVLFSLFVLSQIYENRSFIFSFRSFSDLRKLNSRLSSEQKAKLDYAKRVTHRYQYLSLLSNVKR